MPRPTPAPPACPTAGGCQAASLPSVIFFRSYDRRHAMRFAAKTYPNACNSHHHTPVWPAREGDGGFGGFGGRYRYQYPFTHTTMADPPLMGRGRLPDIYTARQPTPCISCGMGQESPPFPPFPPFFWPPEPASSFTSPGIWPMTSANATGVSMITFRCTPLRVRRTNNS